MATSPVTSTVWDLTKIIALAGATAYLVKVALKSFTAKAGG